MAENLDIPTLEDDEPIAGEPAAEPTGEAGPAPAKRRRRPWLYLLALGVIVALLLPAFSTLQPAYYDRYPSLRGRMAAWRTSTHARVSCSECHIAPGVKGFVTFAARSVPAFYSQLITGPSSTNLLEIPSKTACQRCHTSYRQVSASGDLLIPHRAHVEVLKVNCAVCHQRLVHTSNNEGFNQPDMAMCLNTCHDGTRAANQCHKCHTRKQVPASHKAKEWLVIHPKMTETINCGQCHAWQPDYCKQCHLNRPSSHSGNWKNDHQFRAKSRGTQGCEFCHSNTFCKKCH